MTDRRSKILVAGLLILFVAASASGQASFRFPIYGKVAFVDAPAETLEVDLRDQTGEIIGFVYTDWAGKFDLGLRAEGNYWITIDHPRFKSINFWVRLHGTDGSNLRVVLEPRFNWKDSSVRSTESEELVIVNIPGVTPPLPKQAVDLYWRGIENVREQRLDKAATSFQGALELQPEFYEATLQLGLVRLRENELVDAMRLLEHAAELSPSSTRPLRALGEVYFKRMLYTKAIQALADAKGLGSTTADDAFYLGSSYYKLDRLGPAEEELLRSQSLAQYRDGSYLQLYNLYMKERQPEKALHQLDEYLRLFLADDTYRDVQKRAKALREGIKKAKAAAAQTAKKP